HYEYLLLMLHSQELVGTVEILQSHFQVHQIINLRQLQRASAYRYMNPLLQSHGNSDHAKLTPLYVFDQVDAAYTLKSCHVHLSLTYDRKSLAKPIASLKDGQTHRRCQIK